LAPRFVVRWYLRVTVSLSSWRIYRGYSVRMADRNTFVSSRSSTKWRSSHFEVRNTEASASRPSAGRERGVYMVSSTVHLARVRIQRWVVYHAYSAALVSLPSGWSNLIIAVPEKNVEFNVCLSATVQYRRIRRKLGLLTEFREMRHRHHTQRDRLQTT